MPLKVSKIVSDLDPYSEGQTLEILGSDVTLKWSNLQP